jgi:DNA-binding response OmpR family regulator
MPDMDGRALIHAARQLRAHATLPIVIMSGVVGPKEISDLLQQGAEAFLTKPIRLQELRHYVTAALDRRTKL